MEREEKKGILKKKMQELNYAFENNSKFLREFCTEYDVPQTTAINWFYKFKKEAESDSTTTKAPVVLSEVVDKPKERPMQIGTEIMGVVKNVYNYGALIGFSEHPGKVGLVHVSQIRNKFVSDAFRYFKPGDTIKAKIITHDFKTGRYGLSTIGYDLPDYDNYPQVQSSSPITVHELDKLVGLKNEIRRDRESADQSMIKHMENLLGGLKMSPIAVERLNEIVDEHGAFEVGMRLGEMKREINIDYSLILVNELDRYIRGSL